MDKEVNIQKIIQSVQSSEGENFQYNETAILAEYQKKAANTSSLAIKILSIFGGFFATQTFLGFLALMRLFESEIAILITGIIFIIAAIWLNKTHDKLIFDTLSISTYVTGFVLLGIGLSGLNVEENPLIFIILVVSLLTLLVNQTYMLSFIAVINVSGCLLAFIIFNKSYEFFHLYNISIAYTLAYVILNEAKIITFNKKLSKLYDPTRIGLIFSLLFGLVILVNRAVFEMPTSFIWLSSVLLLIGVIYLVSQIMKRMNITDKKQQIIIYILSVLVLSSTIFAPSILGAILIMLLSFFVNYKTGLVIGITALAYFVSQYYYDLNLTLLVKSIILFSSGILFIVFFLFTRKKHIANEKV